MIRDNKYNTRFYILYGLMIIGVLSVLYFSWISSPRFEYNNLVPLRIAKWADKYENGNLRTAVPLAFLGCLSGLYIIANKLKTGYWFFALIILIGLVFIAELGQLFRPIRTFDWKDIYWGTIGAGIGLIIMYILKRIINKIKMRSC